MDYVITVVWVLFRNLKYRLEVHQAEKGDSQNHGILKVWNRAWRSSSQIHPAMGRDKLNLDLPSHECFHLVKWRNSYRCHFLHVILWLQNVNAYILFEFKFCAYLGKQIISKQEKKKKKVSLANFIKENNLKAIIK